MDKKEETKKLIVMSILAGKIMLQNGAETYRVEDTIVRLCEARGIKYVHSFVTPTGIFLSVEHNNELFSYIKRVKSIKIDLEKIALVNDFSRKFVNSNMTVQEGMDYLNEITTKKAFSKYLRYIFGGFAAAFFSLLFGGNLLDFVSSYFAGFIVLTALDKLSKYNVTFFVKNVIGSIIVTIIAIIFSHIFIKTNIDKIIIGSIMPLVPGVAITNAIRDSISGDFLAGVSRGIEAIIIALGIAFGVGITLKTYILFFGGI
ncbi:MAG: threonine/serine exporter family protein [Firmicutes bacterium]|nr:threonine/serine exporter family protein [Bacillota bacterium]